MESTYNTREPKVLLLSGALYPEETGSLPPVTAVALPVFPLPASAKINGVSRSRYLCKRWTRDSFKKFRSLDAVAEGWRVKLHFAFQLLENCDVFRCLVSEFHA